MSARAWERLKDLLAGLDLVIEDLKKSARLTDTRIVDLTVRVKDLERRFGKGQE